MASNYMYHKGTKYTLILPPRMHRGHRELKVVVEMILKKYYELQDRDWLTHEHNRCSDGSSQRSLGPGLLETSFMRNALCIELAREKPQSTSVRQRH